MNLPGRKSPQTDYRSSDNMAYPINLTAKDHYWSKFAYQFSHEFCHVLSGYERFRFIRHPNNWWFHESVAELASMFVLRRMGERWQHHPNTLWARFAPSHTKYADDLLKSHASNTPSGSFRGWLRENEADLQADPYRRDENGVVALKLLPNFEDEPSGWNAVRHLPAADGHIREYVQSWRASVDAEDRSFVDGIGASLGL